MRNQLLFSVTETSQVGEARRKTSDLAKGLGFDETEEEKAAIIVTELATNLVKHGGGGSLLVRVIHHSGHHSGQHNEQNGKSESRGIELLAIDKGRGWQMSRNVSRWVFNGWQSGARVGSNQPLGDLLGYLFAARHGHSSIGPDLEATSAPW